MRETTLLCLQTDLGVKASAPEEKFGVKLNYYTCATLKCREAHVSYMYIECLSELQWCVRPDVVESQSVDV